jgi:hypothetical protein
MNVAAIKELSVSEAAALAKNSRGTRGVLPRYIQSEIKRFHDTNGEKGLRARLVTPPAGRTYYLIDEQDFLAWEEKRGRSPGDEP